MSNWTESRKFHSPRDRDTIYGNDVRQRIAALGIQELLTAPRSPWQNAYAERLIGSIRRDCLNHFVILDARHLKKNPEFLFRFTAKLFSKQLLLLSDDFGGLMIDWNDLLSLADLVRAFPATYSQC
jgi:transposase InsO family protein